MKCFCAATRRAARSVSRLYEERLRPVDLTPSQFEVLQRLASSSGGSQRSLADALGVDQTTLSRNLKLLIERALVKRERAGTDRRETTYGLTAEGLALLQRALSLWREVQEEMQERLGADWQVAWAAIEQLGTAAESKLG